MARPVAREPEEGGEPRVGGDEGGADDEPLAEEKHAAHVERDALQRRGDVERGRAEGEPHRILQDHRHRQRPEDHRLEAAIEVGDDHYLREYRPRAGHQRHRQRSSRAIGEPEPLRRPQQHERGEHVELSVREIDLPEYAEEEREPDRRERVAEPHGDAIRRELREEDRVREHDVCPPAPRRRSGPR